MKKNIIILLLLLFVPCQIFADSLGDRGKGILSYSSDRDGEALKEAARSGNKETLSRLLKQTGKKQDYLDLALQSAVLGCHPDIVKYIIDAGANVNRLIGIYEPETSLQIAVTLKSMMAQDKYEDMIKILIRGGGDINVKYPSGLTPLSIIIECDDPNIELIKYCISKGAIPTRYDVKFLDRCKKKNDALINLINKNLVEPIELDKIKIITAEALHPKKQIKITVQDNGAIVVKNIKTQEAREISGPIEYGCGSMGCGDAAQLAVFSPDGSIAVTTTRFLGGPTIVWDTDTWKEKFRIDGGDFQMSPDGKWLASYMDSPKIGAVLLLTNLKIGQTIPLSIECCDDHIGSSVIKINGDSGWFKGDYDFNFSTNSQLLIIHTGSGEKEIIKINEIDALKSFH